MVQARPWAERLEEFGEIGILGRPKNTGEGGWPEVGTGMLLSREEGKTREGNKHDAAGNKKAGRTGILGQPGGRVLTELTQVNMRAWGRFSGTKPTGSHCPALVYASLK